MSGGITITFTMEQLANVGWEQFYQNFRYLLSKDRIHMYWHSATDGDPVPKIRKIRVMHEDVTYEFTPKMTSGTNDSPGHGGVGGGHTFACKYGQLTTDKTGMTVPTAETAKTKADVHGVRFLTIMSWIFRIVALDGVSYMPCGPNDPPRRRYFCDTPYEFHVPNDHVPNRAHQLNCSANIESSRKLTNWPGMAVYEVWITYSLLNQLSDDFVQKFIPAYILNKRAQRHGEASGNMPPTLTIYCSILDYRTASTLEDATTVDMVVPFVSPAAFAALMAESRSQLKESMPQNIQMLDGKAVIATKPWFIYPHGPGAVLQMASGNLITEFELYLGQMKAVRTIVVVAVHRNFVTRAAGENLAKLPSGMFSGIPTTEALPEDSNLKTSTPAPARASNNSRASNGGFGISVRPQNVANAEYQ